MELSRSTPGPPLEPRGGYARSGRRRIIGELEVAAATVRLRANIARILCWFIPEGSLNTVRAAIYRYVVGMKLERQVSIMAPPRISGTGRGLYRRLHVGRRSTISRHTVLNLDDSIDIGTDVCIGTFVKIYTSDHEIGPPNRRMDEHVRRRPVKIGDGAWIGMGAIILPGACIGDGAVVGAGSVVRGEVPAHTLVSGVPAKEVRKLEH